MAYPILAAQNTWWKPNVSSVTRASITEIEIMDSYTPDSSVTVVDSWDASEAKDGSITCYVIGTKLIMAGNGSGKIAANEDSNMCFLGFEVMSVFSGANLLDMSNVINMHGMFFKCYALTTIDVSTWDVSNVVTMSAVFGRCTSLASIQGINSWDTGNVETMQLLFCFTDALTSLNLANWNTSRVTDMERMFYMSKGITSVEGLSEWVTSNLTNVDRLFYECAKLISVDLTHWDISKITSTYAMFYACSNLSNVGDLSRWDTSNLTNTSYMFSACPKLTTVGDLSQWDMSKNKNMREMFNYCPALTMIGDLSEWDTSATTDMRKMFSQCEQLTSVGNISNWNVSNVTYMGGMFQYCSKLTGIGDLANWNPSSCTDMSFMFWGASSIGEIDVTNWDVSKVTTLDHFAAHAGLRRKGIENWNTSSLVNANAAFHNCAEEELDLSGWDVSKVEVFSQMFENSPNLKRIKGLEKWNTSAGWDFSGMFERCYVLEELDLSSFDTSKAKNGVVNSGNNGTSATLNNMFLSCNNLKKVTVGPNFSINGDGTNTAAANKAILPTPSTDYIAGADGMWYTFNGDSYAPNAMKDRTYNTYYASKNLIRDLSVRVNNGTILNIVEAIREKVPNLEPTLLSDLDDVILSKVFEPVLDIDEEGNAIITATALSIDEEGNATIIV